MNGLPPIFRVTIVVAAAATITATVLRIVHPFDHGIWLIAYLLLVGTVAQYLLARGQAVLTPEPASRTVRSEALLWCIGVIAVPVGVLAGTKLLVVAGSVALIVALLTFSIETRPLPRHSVPGRSQAWALCYLGLLVFMTLSVFVGIGLASDVPWT